MIYASKKNWNWKNSEHGSEVHFVALDKQCITEKQDKVALKFFSCNLKTAVSDGMFILISCKSFLFPNCIYRFIHTSFVEFSEKSSGESFLAFPSSHWTMPVTFWHDVSSEEITHWWCRWISRVVINRFTSCSLGKLSNIRLSVISCFSFSCSVQVFCMFNELHYEYVDMHYNLCKLFQIRTHI